MSSIIDDISETGGIFLCNEVTIVFTSNRTSMFYILVLPTSIKAYFTGSNSALHVFGMHFELLLLIRPLHHPPG